MSEERHHDLESKLPNADMQGAPAALLRAAQRAREIARQTNTAIVIVRDGVLVEERVEKLDDSPADATASTPPGVVTGAGLLPPTADDEDENRGYEEAHE